MISSKLVRQVGAHEGCERFVYKDTMGYYTIGRGRCVDSRVGKGLSQQEIDYLLLNDLNECFDNLDKFAWFRKIDDEVRQGVIIELRFNLGLKGLLSFKRMISAIEVGDFDEAAEEMLDSKWSKQVGEIRSNNMAYRLIHGAYPS